MYAFLCDYRLDTTWRVNAGAAAGIADVLERTRRSVPIGQTGTLERNLQQDSDVPEYNPQNTGSLSVASTSFEQAVKIGVVKALVKLLEDAYRKICRSEPSSRPSSASHSTGIEAAFAEAVRGISHLAFCYQSQDSLPSNAKDGMTSDDATTRMSHLYHFPISRGSNRKRQESPKFPPMWGQTTLR